jgi:hypothetical protein
MSSYIVKTDVRQASFQKLPNKFNFIHLIVILQIINISNFFLIHYLPEWCVCELKPVKKFIGSQTNFLIQTAK